MDAGSFSIDAWLVASIKHFQKLKISYLNHKKSTDHLPYTQPESTLAILHISLKRKGQNLLKEFAHLEKMISQII